MRPFFKVNVLENSDHSQSSKFYFSNYVFNESHKLGTIWPINLTFLLNSSQ